MTEAEMGGEYQKMFHFLFMLSAKSGSIVEEAGRVFLILKQADPKALFMTARPGRTRAFIPFENFMHNWVKHNEAYLANPPRIALIHSDMKEDANGVAQAIKLLLSNPRMDGAGVWRFQVEFLKETMQPQECHDITLFVDWVPAVICPEPIRVQVPSLIKTV